MGRAAGRLRKHRAAVVRSTVPPVRNFLREHSWWQTAIFIIGLLMLVMAVSVMFLGLNSAPREIATNEPLASLDSPHFAAAVSHLVNAPIERGGTVQVLNNGDGFLPVLLRDIAAARMTINLLVFIWEDGTFSDRVLDALIERQRHGIAVRVLVDGLGAKSAPDDRFEVLEQTGGRVEKFRTPKFGTWTRFHRRNHRRSIVIDGEVGFAGGMAIYDKWLGSAQDPEHWRDMMFRVTGPLARSLQAAFVDSWVSSSGEILVGPSIYGESTGAASGIERFLHHVNSPADDDQSMAYFYLLPILAAREKVYVTTPYFIPDDPLKAALQDKARSGVDVQLLLPGKFIDNASARYSGQTHYEDLMAAGVRIFGYRPTFIHTKFVVIDGKWSVIGSPNLNSRSRQLDEENALAILDPALGRQLEETFFRDLAQADEIHMERWQKRSLLLRLVQLAARVLDQQS